MTTSLFKSFRALNRHSARQVLDILRRGPKSVADIHSQVKFGSRANVSQALTILLKAGLVSRHRQGRQNFYQLQPEPFLELLSYLNLLHRDAKRGSR